MSEVAAVLRLSYPQALSRLLRFAGSLDRAEDLLQEAAAKAVAHWKSEGIPRNPAGWLVRAAKNHGIDGYRRYALERRYIESSLQGDARADLEPTPGALRDDMLRLIFVCCHPVLSQESQVALTLKAVAGLTVDEIAGAFLVQPKTIEQRITRAKRRIGDKGIAYEVPERKELGARLSSVLAVIHLIFNEGYSASIDAPLIRHELCRAAIAQAQRLHALFPGDPEVEGLLALLLLTHSRAGARLAANGDVVPLHSQNRALWDQRSRNVGLALLDAALRRGRPGNYQIQAAISATHCRAPQFEDTDWAEIVRLYDVLLTVAPSPVVELNRAVAISQRHGASVGLAAIEALGHDTTIGQRHHFHAVRAGLLEELGRLPEAREAYDDACAHTKNSDERKYFTRRADEIERKIAKHVGKSKGSSSSS